MKNKLFILMISTLFLAFTASAQELGKAPLSGKGEGLTQIIPLNKVDQDAYAGNTSSGVYGSIDLATGAITPTGTIAASPFPMAEEFDGLNVYRVYNDFTIGTVGSDGTYTNIGTLTGFSGTPTGLAWDWVNETMYVMVLDGSSLPNLCTLDMGTLVLTQVGIAGTGMIIGIDFANDGYIYGPAIDDDMFYQIDPATGTTTSIGATGIDLNYGQDVSFDAQKNLLYAITCGGAYRFGTYDLATGAFTEISAVTGQFATFVITKEPTANVDPVSTTFDLYNEYEVQTNILWSLASAITAVEEGGTALAVDQYDVNVNVLTINPEYFTGAAENDEYIFTVHFDTGEHAFLTVQVTDLTPVVTWPTATNVTYGQTLAESLLESGYAHVPGDPLTEVTGTFEFVDPTIAPDTGTYETDVVFTPAAYESNNPVYGTVTVTVDKAIADITFSDMLYTYDGTNKSATVTTDPVGLSYDIEYTLEGVPATPNAAGTYVVVVIINDANYEGTATDDLIINQAPLSITAEDKVKVYGEVDPMFTVVYDGFVAGQDETVLGGTLDFNREVGEDVNTYLITPSGLTSTNYDITYVDGLLEITPAPLSITAEDKAKVYGEVDPMFTVVYDGFVAGQDETVLGGTLDFNREVGEDVNTYLITPSGLTSTNYDITYVDGLLEITPAPLSITAEDKAKVYGEVDPAFTVVFDGFVFDEDETALDGTLLIERDPGENVGTYVITASGLTSVNYDILYVEGTLEITPRELVLTGSFTVLSKYYDGTVDATMDVNSLELFETVDGDEVALDYIVIEFAGPNVGESIVVSIISADLTGADIDNYTLSLDGAPESSADITAVIVTIGGTFTVIDKYYDGTTEATISENNLELIGVINDEDVILVDVVAEFESPEVGEDILVLITSANIDGVDAGNYTLDLTGAPTTIANIMAVTYTVIFTVDGENGQLVAEVDGNAIESGDEVVEESDVLFTAIPDDNYKVAEWTVNDNLLDSYTELTYLYENLDQNIVVTVSFEEVVGISEISSVDVSVFPNPARDMFTVESSEMINKIKLVNISGQVVNEINVDAMRTEINVSSLRTGIYFMQIHTSDGITTERVQITR